jgi:hypothetical protein
LLYKDQGNYTEAETHYKQSLAIVEKAIGPESPEVQILLKNMAELYQEYGKEAKLKRLKERDKGINSRGQ